MSDMTPPPPGPPVPPPPPSGPAMSGGAMQGAKTNGFAIASLVLGILGLVSCGFTFSIAPLLALIFGAVGMKQIRVRNEAGRGLAVAGLVMGIVGLVLTVLAILFLAGVILSNPTPK